MGLFQISQRLQKKGQLSLISTVIWFFRLPLTSTWNFYFTLYLETLRFGFFFIVKEKY